eukprot:3419674-Heterocapsa_arctica.AAC.1
MLFQALPKGSRRCRSRRQAQPTLPLCLGTGMPALRSQSRGVQRAALTNQEAEDQMTPVVQGRTDSELPQLARA